MAPSYVPVCDIAVNCGELNVMVRVVRLWTIPSFNNASVAGSIEMILIDKKGDKIHCTVRKYLVSRFMSVLVEGQCYRICCLALVPNLGSYRTTRHESKLVFHLKTTVSPIELPEVDLYGISSTPFSDILNATLDPDYLIDVIGLMTGLSQPKEYEREGKVSKMSVLELTSENLKVECALFGEYVDQIQSYVRTGEIELPVVVLQSVKVKSFRGRAGLQNVMFASKILFNPDIEAVVNFKNSISIQGSLHDPSFNIYREALPVSVEDDFMKCTPHSTIERLTVNKESGYFIIMGTINSVIEDGPWWYCACRCGRSVMPEGGMYFCDVCDTHMLSVSPRFKLKLEVEDSTGVGVFVLFERECSYMFRKTRAEFFMEHMKSPESVRANVYPSVFHELNGRKMLFKIETKVVSPNQYHGTFRVRRICDDSSILSMFSLSGADLTPTKSRMEDPTHLERMGRELKCPICLSLLSSAVSLTCNHVFCNLCIVKSSKSSSACPVCKLPFTRREVRPAPHMDNLVNIYKNMELASGMSLFLTQHNVPLTKLSDEETQCEGDGGCGKEDDGGIHQNHAQKRKPLKRTRKNTMTSTKCPGPDTSKPSFPAKKRVQVPQNPLSETPLKNSGFGDSPNVINKDGTEKDSVVANERPLQSKNNELVLSPFFWLREEEGGEKLTQQSNGDRLSDDGPTPIPPSFSDLKDSDDENPSKVTSSDEVQNKACVDLFDSEMFEWTQRPCSPELFSSPVKMQALNPGEIDEIQEDLVAASPELERNLSSADADNTNYHNPKEGNRLTDVLPPSMTSQFRSSNDPNGIKKSMKVGRKTMEKARQEQIVEQGPIDGMNVDLNRTLEVSKDQTGDKKKSSNLGNTNRRGKRVCFNTTIPTAQPACTVSNISGILGNGEMNMANNSYTSHCKQETEKCAPHDIAGKCQRKISGKQKLEHVQDPSEELSSMQNQTNGFAGSMSSILSLETDNNGKTSNIRQRKGKFSRKTISCSGQLSSAKRLKLSSDCLSKAEAGEEIQPNEIIQRGTDVKALNDTSKEKYSPLKDEPVLQKCESHAKKYECAFCLSSEESEASGPMMHYYGGKPVIADYEGGSKVTHSHRNCTEWAPNVYFEDNNAVNLEAEINRSRRIKCSFCGLRGAALGCYEKSCRRSFHVPCAKWTPQCRWDMENFVMLCPLHGSSKLPGESSGSQYGSTKCTAREGKSLACKHGTANQSRTAHGLFKKVVLCCSALSVQERDVVSAFEKASKVTVLKKWDSSVTHVIASTHENGACRRTLKVLLGILEGKWILNIEWIKACMKEMEPVDEELYEINVDIHGIRDGPRLGRLRVSNKQPKLFNGYKFYFMGDFVPSYKGYLQDLVTAAGGVILNRKPMSGDQITMSPDMHPCQTLIIYSLELPDKCTPLKRDTIFNQRRCNAEVLASSTGSKVASNTWILNSIAACKLQSLDQ